MQQTKDPNPTAATFASLLAALAAPASKPEPEWEDEPVEELTSLSYESALKAHARYKPSPAPAGMPSYAPEAAAPAPAPASVSVASYAAAAAASAPPQPARAPQSPFAPPQPKTASVTIRMSEDECEQLRRRAAEAGMTISAYLRSCTFEAESLRAQVKQAMAEMRAATAAATAAKVPSAREEAPAPRRSWRNMMDRFTPHSAEFQHAARA